MIPVQGYKGARVGVLGLGTVRLMRRACFARGWRDPNLLG